MSNSTDAAGNVVFNYLDKPFSLVFSVTYNDSGVPNPYEFSSSPDAKTQASGKQVVPKADDPPAEDWTQKPEWMRAGTIITIFGGGIPLLLSGLKELLSWIKGKDAKDREALEKTMGDLGKLSDRYKEILNQAQAAAEALNELDVSNQKFDLSNCQKEIETAIDISVNKTMENRADPSNQDLTIIRKKAAEAIKDKISVLYEEIEGEKIFERLNKFNLILDAVGKRSVIDNIIEKRISAFDLVKQPFTVDWFSAVVDKSVAKKRSADVAAEIGRSEETSKSWQKQAENTREQMENFRKQLATERFEAQVDKHMVENGEAPNKTDAEREAAIKSLNDKISSLDREASEAERAAEATEAAKRDLETKKNSLDEDTRIAEGRREASTGDAFPAGE